MESAVGTYTPAVLIGFDRLLRVAWDNGGNNHPSRPHYCPLSRSLIGQGTLIGYLTQCSNWVLMGPILVIGYVTPWDTQSVGERGRSRVTNGPEPGKSDWRGAVIGLISYVITSHLAHYGKPNTSLICDQQNENNEVGEESFQQMNYFLARSSLQMKRRVRT